MQTSQRVSEMAAEVLAGQAGARTERTGEAFEEALKAVLETEADRQLVQLREGLHRDERAEQWQKGLAPKRAKERRNQARQEKLSRTRIEAWQSFMQRERLDLELRKDGKLAKLMGEPLQG